MAPALIILLPVVKMGKLLSGIFKRNSRSDINATFVLKWKLILSIVNAISIYSIAERIWKIFWFVSYWFPNSSTCTSDFLLHSGQNIFSLNLVNNCKNIWLILKFAIRNVKKCVVRIKFCIILVMVDNKMLIDKAIIITIIILCQWLSILVCSSYCIIILVWIFCFCYFC